jgi:hypothetical protein
MVTAATDRTDRFSQQVDPVRECAPAEYRRQVKDA